MLVIAERHAAKHGRDGDNPPLRAVSTIRNDSALAVGAYIPKFRVPPESAIYKAFVDPMRSVHEQREDLSWWQSSSGSALAAGEVFVGAGERETKFSLFCDCHKGSNFHTVSAIEFCHLGYQP